MACEDMQVIDLNGDGKTGIVASGKATKILKFIGIDQGNRIFLGLVKTRKPYYLKT
ncbi:MAG: hypothetical protein H0V14_04300 [Chitinophagaceae bacterium]|nr:hypothetical protein [Chitinophagaceae bacterium]